MHAPFYRLHEDQNRWNFFFSLFFLAVLILSILGVWKIRGGFPSSLPVLDLVLMAFASMRITRLVVYDKITRFFREWFVDRKVVKMEDGLYVEIIQATHGVRSTVNDLLGCPWCVGMWSGLIVTFCYLIFPWAWYVILFLAIAGMGSFLQILANMVGWEAENLKSGAREN